MKRFFHITSLVCYLSLIFFLPSITTGDSNSNQINKGGIKKSEARYLTGAIIASSFADANLGTKSEIYVKDSRGNTVSCIITDTTTMYDEKGNAITLDKLTKGLNVKIKYIITKSGIKEAQLIKILTSI